MQNIILGNSIYVRQWVIDHDPYRWDSIVTRLENFDISLPIKRQKLPEVGSVVKKSCPYMIRDGYTADD